MLNWFTENSWSIARSSGLLSLALANLSIIFGLLLAGRILKPRPKQAFKIRIIHETLAFSCLFFLIIHIISLYTDKWLKASLPDLLIPFFSDYKTWQMSLGIIAFWLLTTLSFLMWNTKTKKNSRKIHGLIVIVWIISIVHSFTIGTDKNNILIGLVFFSFWLVITDLIIKTRFIKRNKQKILK